MGGWVGGGGRAGRLGGTVEGDRWVVQVWWYKWGMGGVETGNRGTVGRKERGEGQCSRLK